MPLEFNLTVTLLRGTVYSWLVNIYQKRTIVFANLHFREKQVTRRPANTPNAYEMRALGSFAFLSRKNAGTVIEGQRKGGREEGREGVEPKVRICVSFVHRTTRYLHNAWFVHGFSWGGAKVLTKMQIASCEGM